MKTCLNTATTRGYGLADDIRYCGKYKYEGIEIETDKIDEYLKTSTINELKKKLEDSNLKVAALMAFPFSPFSENPAGFEKLKKYAGTAAFLGSQILLAYIAGRPPEGMHEEKAFEVAADIARKYGGVAEEHGLKIAMESIGRHPFMPGPSQALRVIEKSGHPSLGLVIDTFHCFRSGIAPEEIKKIPLEKLLIVHINDSEDKPVSEINDANRLYPGKGVLPLKQYLHILKEKGYEGFLSVEIFRPEYWQDEHENIVRNSKEGLDIVMK